MLWRFFRLGGSEEAGLKNVLSSFVCRAARAWFPGWAVAIGAGLSPAYGQGIVAFPASEHQVDRLGYSIVQAADGTLFVSGSSMLTFDGDRWGRHSANDAFWILGLDVGIDGRVWAAAYNDLGWFEQAPDSRWVFRSLRSRLTPEDLASGPIWYVFADGAGTTFVSAERIFRWNGTEFKSWRKPGTRRLFATRSEGVVYVHYLTEGLFTVDATGPTLVVPQEKLPGAGIISILRRGDRRLLGSNEGFSEWRDGAVRKLTTEIDDFLRDKKLTRCVALPDGRLVVGTLMGGIAVITAEGRLERFIDERDGLPSNSVSSFHLDREGLLWATSGTQIIRISLLAASTRWGASKGLNEQNYPVIARMGERVLVASETRLLGLTRDEGVFREVPDVSGRFHSLVGSPTGLLAAGYRGATHWDGTTARKIFSTEHDVLAAVERRGRPGKYYATAAREVFEISPEHEPQLVAGGLPTNASSLAEDERGQLWIGTFGRGLWLVDPRADQPATAVAAARPGLPAFTGTVRVRAARDGSVLVLANGGAWVRPAGREQFLAVDGFPVRAASAVSGVAPDGVSFWVGLAESDSRAQVVGRVTLRADGAAWTPHAVAMLESVGRVLSLLEAEDDQRRAVLWIGGTKSVLRHTVPGALRVPAPPQPLLRVYARGHGEATRRLAPASLPFDTHAVEAEFAVPDFGRRAALRLESKIDGMGEDWQPVGAGSRRELTGLRDGRYTLRVRAVSEIGEAGPEAVFAFRVLPPWWRRGWFISAFAAALMPAVYGLYRLRVRALKRQNAILEARVRRRTEELELANAAKTEFVANMSHDIRNPLGGIVGLTYALEQTRLDPRQQEFVATMRKCSLYLSTLVDDVLDFASIEAGRVVFRPAPFEPRRLLQSVAETMRATARARGAVLATESADDLPPLLDGDEGRIQQILVNYVANAIKYAGGAIELSATRPSGAPGTVEFSVRDHGPGIAAADQARLFEKFTRLHTPQAGEVRGHGLGLASCRLLAEQMGGTVGIESAPGAGARFSLRLPLKVAAAPAEAPVPKLAAAKALVVEDEDSNAWAAAAVLEQLGLGCERARSGAEALEKFAAGPFAVVLLDCNLPDMDGTEIAPRIRALETEHAPALLLAVTAYCTTEDRARCLASGMDEFVGKPLTPDKLRRVFAAQADRLRAAAPAEAIVPPRGEAVDLGLLARIAGHAGGEIATQLDRVVDGLRGYEKEIDAASQRGDYQGVGLAAHRLLGQALLVGAGALAEAARHLEDAARAKVPDPAVCGDWLRRVHAESSALMAAVGHHHPTTTTA
ncbi:MAG: response regulator [Opitutaceae bacterium]|nr:response regulator [Opitutaceae bacterium]